MTKAKYNCLHCSMGPIKWKHLQLHFNEFPSHRTEQSACHTTKNTKKKNEKKRKSRKGKYRCAHCDIGPLKLMQIRSHFDQFPSHRTDLRVCSKKEEKKKQKKKNKKGDPGVTQRCMQDGDQTSLQPGLDSSKQNVAYNPYDVASKDFGKLRSAKTVNSLNRTPGYRCPQCHIGPLKWGEMCLHFNAFPSHRAEQLTCWNTPAPCSSALLAAKDNISAVPFSVGSGKSCVIADVREGVWDECSDRSSSSSGSSGTASSNSADEQVTLNSTRQLLAPAQVQDLHSIAINQVPSILADLSNVSEPGKTVGSRSFQVHEESKDQASCRDEPTSRVEVRQDNPGQCMETRVDEHGEKRKHSEIAPEQKPVRDSLKMARLRDWLKMLDNGQGTLLEFEDALIKEFDGDLTQIAASFIGNADGQSIVYAIDSLFWEAVGISRTGHKLLFARGIAKLQTDSVL